MSRNKHINKYEDPVQYVSILQNVGNITILNHNHEVSEETHVSLHGQSKHQNRQRCLTESSEVSFEDM